LPQGESAAAYMNVSKASLSQDESAAAYINVNQVSLPQDESAAAYMNVNQVSLSQNESAAVKSTSINPLCHTMNLLLVNQRHWRHLVRMNLPPTLSGQERQICNKTAKGIRGRTVAGES
jgi:hypothetical protein